MTRTNPTPHDGQGSVRCHGVVSGYLFKMVRESIGLTQVELAEQLGVDSTTVQGWESGRRSLTAFRADDLARLRTKLVRLGAPPSVFSVLGDAIEADLVIADAVEAGGRNVDPDHHPLATSVHRRDTTNLITWPFAGLLPLSWPTFRNSDERDAVRFRISQLSASPSERGSLTTCS